MGETTERFYDFFERRYTSNRLPGPTDRITREQHLLILGVLLDNLMDSEHPIAHLYAMLLARVYCQSDPVLMERYGEQVASYLHGEPVRDPVEGEPVRRRRKTR